MDEVGRGVFSESELTRLDRLKRLHTFGVG